MNLPARYWHPDENAEILPDLTEDERRWILHRIDPTWCLDMTLDEAWAYHERVNEPQMDALIREVDEDNREAADPIGTLADLLSPWLY